MIEDKKNKNLFIFTGSQYIRPTIEATSYLDYITNGQDNEFFYYVINRYLGSPTNSAIINGKKNLIYGRGLSIKGTRHNVVERIKLKTILSPKTVRNVINDYVLQNMFSIDIIENKKNELKTISHVAIERLAPEQENNKGIIENYYYSRDFRKKMQDGYEPVKVPAFNGKPQKRSVYVGRPYQSGATYFSSPQYVSSLPYAEFEEEASNLYVSSIKNGLSAGFVINVEGGVAWTDEEKRQFKQKIDDLLTGGTNAGQFIVSFNGAEVKVTVEAIPTNENIHQQWESLTEISTQQLLTGHQVVSPMLFGVKDNTGLGNNADELDTAEQQFVKRVIKPDQDFITDALEEILATYGIFLELEFLPLTQIPDEKTVPTVELRKEHICLSDEGGATAEMAEALIQLGEEESNEWNLLCSSEVDYQTDDNLFDLLQFATSTGVARPNANSSQDSADIKIRYRYVGNRTPEREFCRKMVTANKLYRKEDILQMGEQTVNSGFGYVAGGKSPNTPYSIWLWKGGGKISAKYPNGTCRHKWQREIYLKVDGGVDVNSPLATTITTAEARRKGFSVPTNAPAVGRTPHNNKS